MYIFTPEAALSVVVHKDDPATLIVRSRIDGQLENFLGIATKDVHTSVGTDYKHRAFVSRRVMGEAMLRHLDQMAYDNVKDAAEGDQAELIMDVWEAYAMRADIIRRRGSI